MNEDQLSQIVFQRRCHVLAIAVDDYDGLQYDGRGIAQLTKPRTDAEAFFKVLKEKYDGFSDGNWKLLAGEDACPKAVESALFELLDTAKGQSDDQVLIYYAGHGVLDKANKWRMLLRPNPSLNFNPNHVPEAEAFSFLEFFGTVSALECHTVLLVLDGCHAEAVFQNINTAQGTTPIYAITAAGSKQVSFEIHPAHDGFNSPFSAALIGTFEAGNDANGSFSAVETQKMIQNKLANATIPQTVKCAQLGGSSIDTNKGDIRPFNFRLIRPLPPPLAEVKRLFMEDLNFSPQKRMIEEGPDPDAGVIFKPEGNINFMGAKVPMATLANGSPNPEKQVGNFYFMIKSLLGLMKSRRELRRKLPNPKLVTLLLTPNLEDPGTFDWDCLGIDHEGEPALKKAFLQETVASLLKNHAVILILKTTIAIDSDAFLQTAVDDIARAIIPTEYPENPLFFIVCDIRPSSGPLKTEVLAEACRQHHSNLLVLPPFTALKPHEIDKWAIALAKLKKPDQSNWAQNLDMDALQVFDLAEFVQTALDKLGHPKDALPDIFTQNSIIE